ncbi:MAG: hypothetical protein HRU06_18575 [Oceanospirillaceae bacterium]|nr:hypothetical protein [Oceanospirillaceae bacterium]
MEYDLVEQASYEHIKTILLDCVNDDVVNCYSLENFDVAKSVLIKEKLVGKTVQLLDEDDYVLQQVTSKKREVADGEVEFSDRQLAVIKALEKVFNHCKREGIKVIGYSDELVAYPANCNDQEQASEFCLEINTSETYKGA